MTSLDQSPWSNAKIDSGVNPKSWISRAASSKRYGMLVLATLLVILGFGVVVC